MSAGTQGQAALPPLPPKWTGKFRKLPVVIEAVQLTRENAAEVWRWVAPAVKIGQALDVTIDINKGLTVSTLEGDMRASFSDWIIKGVKGEFYTCKDDIFRQTYEPEGAAQDAQPASDLALLAAACAHRDVLAAALARIEGRTDGYDPGTNEHDVHGMAASALAFRPVTQPAPELAEVERKLSITLNALQRIDRTRRTVVDQVALWDIAQEAIDKVTDVDGQLPKPAPELAAAMAESRMLRDSLAEALAIARELPPSTRSAELARNRNLSAIAKRAGLPS